MMFRHTLVRFFHSGEVAFAAQKSQLALLRKKTGYTFANCKKALKMHNNDLNMAESWLKEQAQALGWSKATKLEGRQTTQGLIGVAVNDKHGVLVEVNCETDFVAKNKEFENYMSDVVAACFNHVKNIPKSTELLTKVGLDSEQLKSLKSTDGKSLADKLALVIGSVGENASLKRAECLLASDNLHLTGYAHPSGKEHNSVMLGRVGGLLVLKPLDSNKEDVEELGKQICQHIVGMSPTKIGSKDDKIQPNQKEEEDRLLHQEFLLDESVTVKEVLEENNIDVVYFKRFECGETTNAIGEQPLELIETCQ